jgi:hypothetical protein
MSENKNYDENIEVDELNIKSHLNDSLDLSGISMSEDLINRTLLAIKKQSELPSAVADVNKSLTENDTINQTANRKVIQWNRYFRAFAGVAAAVVVVVVGYSLASNGAFSGYKTKTSNSEDQVYDMAVTKEAADENAKENLSDSSTTFQDEESSMNALAPSESTPEDDYTVNSGYGDSTTTTDGTQDPNSSENAGIMGGQTQESTGTSADIERPKYSIVAEVPVTASKEDSKEGGTSSGTTGSAEKSSIQSTEPSMKKSFTAQETTLSFRDIFQADPSKASSLTITDEKNDVIIVLTKKEDIQSFYTMMEQHQFTNGNQAGDTTNYVVEIVTPTPSMSRYTMYVGNSIVVDYADQVTSSHSVYTTTTLSELATAIQEFCQKHNK